MSLLDDDFTSDQLIGTVIDDRFEILELIGRGGNGLVYKAYQKALNRVVAIKVLHSHLQERHSQDRFRQELRTISALSHPNILSLYSAGALSSGQPYMVLEHLQGQTLADAIKSGLRWPDKRCLPWLNQVLKALEYAHVNGVIHRDLKPSNVVLSESDDPHRCVRLVDFGIARVINLSNEEKQRLTQTGAVLGTPLYMSPEQCEGKPTDPRSDIYGFGCVMYETLTGKPPFDGASAYDTMCRHLHDAPPAMNGGGAVDVPFALESIVRRCLEKDAIKRYQSAAEVLQAIELYESKPDATKSSPERSARKPQSGGGAINASATSQKSKRSKFGLLQVIYCFIGAVVALILLRSLAIQSLDTYVIGGLVQEAKTDIDADRLEAATKKLKSAEEWFDRLSKVANVSSAGVIDGWRKLGFGYLKRGNTPLEAATLSHVIDLEKKELGPASPVVVSALSNLGETYMRASDLTKAQETLEEAITLSQDDGGIDSRALGLYRALGMTLREQGRYADSERVWRFVLSKDKQAGIVGSQKAQVLERLAEVLFVQRKYEEALTVFLESKVLKDRYDDIANPEHIYNSYYAGLSAQALKKHSQAEVLMKHCLAMQSDTKTFLKELPDVYCQIGYALAKQQRYKEAEPYLRKSAELLASEKLLHPFTKLVVSSLNDLALGEVLVKTERAAEAKPYLVRASQVQLDPQNEFIHREAKALLN